MINKELKKIEKCLRLINKDFEADLENISEIVITKSKENVLITLVDLESERKQDFMIEKNRFEEIYKVGWF